MNKILFTKTSEDLFSEIDNSYERQRKIINENFRTLINKQLTKRPALFKYAEQDVILMDFLTNGTYPVRSSFLFYPAVLFCAEHHLNCRNKILDKYKYDTQDLKIIFESLFAGPVEEMEPFAQLLHSDKTEDGFNIRCNYANIIEISKNNGAVHFKMNDGHIIIIRKASSIFIKKEPLISNYQYQPNNTRSCHQYSSNMCVALDAKICTAICEGEFKNSAYLHSWNEVENKTGETFCVDWNFDILIKKEDYYPLIKPYFNPTIVTKTELDVLQNKYKEKYGTYSYKMLPYYHLGELLKNYSIAKIAKTIPILNIDNIQTIDVEY